MRSYRNYGGVSIFIVIFTALLVTVVTVGFTQLMIHNQQQTTSNDLSQRAYNSALGGVEDSKRILLALQDECNNGTAKCSTLKTIIDNQKCDTVQKADTSIATNVTSSGEEVPVGSTNDGQAYTCVKIVPDTNNYVDSVNAGDSVVVPLNGVSSFTKVRITWFSRSDTSQPGTDNAVHTPNQGGIPVLSLPPQTKWSSSYPSVMRAQYIPYNVPVSSLSSSARAVFLYPVPSPGSGFTATGDFNLDKRRASGAVTPGPMAAYCYGTYSTVGGACSITLSLPAATSRGYLQLGAVYNATHFTVELIDSANAVVNFDNVEPYVDSTGRAGDLFRRVEARIKLGGVSLPLPNSGVSVKGSLCKDFALKDSSTGAVYEASVSLANCEPDE